MFHSISGTLTEKNDENAYILTQGIEWEIHISRSTCNQLPDTGADCRLHVYLHHREDVMKLFGFFGIDEKRLFLNLMKVDGVGPALAMKILSGIKPDECIKAIEQGDVARLEEIPGLGTKTAQKIILRLAGKLALGEKEDAVQADIVKALVGMGFDPQKAKQAVKLAAERIKVTGNGKGDEGIVPDREELEKRLLKAALVNLST